MGKQTQHPASKCEYLVGDDSCSAVKASDLGALRAEVCVNEIKDKCCYLCAAREKCEVSCDIPVGSRKRKPRDDQRISDRTVFQVRLAMECGNCVHYLQTECPRDYGRDNELWRRQDPCEKFGRSKKPVEQSGRNSL